MQNRFVIHEHHARNLHFDLRLEMAGVLRSWAVPKGISLNPADKRLAVLVPDHSLSYISFEGRLAEGTYGAGEVRIWDEGEYETAADPAKQFEKGKIELEFYGEKVRGEFALVKIHRGDKNWLLIKIRDRYADPDWKLKTVLPLKAKTSKKGGRST